MATEIQHAPDYLPLLHAALGGVLTLGGGVVALVLGEKLKAATERRRMASAFAGEIKAVLELAAARRIRAVLEEGKRLYESGNQWTESSWSIDRDYVGIYRAHPEKIGLFLSPLPGKIARFYTLAFALMEALTHIGTQKWHLSDRQYMLRTFDENLEILSTVEALGGELVAALESMAVS